MVIYITTNISNGKKYIGKDRHNNPNYLGGGVNIKKDIKEFGRDSFKKEILEYCDDLNDLKLKEEIWLNKFDAKNNPIFYNSTNKSFGSDNGPSLTDKYLNRGNNISISRTGIKHVQKWNHTECSKNKISISNKKPKSKSHKENIAKSRKKIDWGVVGVKISNKTKGQKRPTTSDKLFNNPKIMIPISQYDLEGNYIKTWNGISEAARYYNKDNSGFRSCALGKQKTCAGFKWSYNKLERL